MKRENFPHALSGLGFVHGSPAAPTSHSLRHPLHALGFQSARGVVTDTAQPVGTVEPGTDRVVTQPTNNPVVNQALATDAMGEYRSALQDIVKGVPGASLAASRAAKNPKRLAEKIVGENQPPQTISDYGAAQISVSSPEARDAVVEAVRKRFPIVREKDDFWQGDPVYRYRSYSMQLQMPNGISQELQILPKQVFEANASEHKDYKAARNAVLEGKSGKRARMNARKKNDAAMDKFVERNSTTQVRKGSQVVMRDGSRGTVQYVDPNMNIARLRTADGRKLTLRRSDLAGFVDDSGEQGSA